MSDSSLKEYYDYLNSSKKEFESITTPVPTDSFKTSETSEEDKIYNSMGLNEEILYPESIYKSKKTLTELAEDEEFATRAERFLEGVGKNENIFEYLRDSEYSLSAAAQRSFEVGKWTDEQKEDYNYLTNQFNNAELDGFKERFGLVKDIAVDVVADPLNILAALFAIPTGGATLAGRAALGTAAKVGIKKLTKSQLDDAVAKGTATKVGLPLLGAAEGAAWAGPHDYFLQDINVDLGLQDDIDYTQIAATSALGGAIGATVGGVIVGGTQGFAKLKNLKRNKDGEIVGPPSPKIQEKIDKFSNEDEINSAANRPRKEIEKNTELDLGISNSSINMFYKVISNTFGKPTAKFLNNINDSDKLKKLLADFRYDYDVGVITAGAKGVRKQSYGEALGMLTGKYMYGLGKSLNVLEREGWRGKIWGKQNNQLAQLLRDKKINVSNVDKYQNSTYNGIEIDNDVIEAYKGIRTQLDDSYKEAAKFGLFKQGTQYSAGYFPRVFKYEAIEKNREKFEDLIINAGHADPINEKTLKKLGRDKEDKTLEGFEFSDKGTDKNTFGIDFLEEAGGDVTRAKELKAKKIVDDMLEQKYNPFAEIDKSGAGGSFNSRRFTKIADNDLQEFLEDDVQNILTDYFTNISQAITRTNYFGKTIKDFDKNKLQPIYKELRAKGKNGKPKLSREEADNVIKGLKLMHGRVTGLDPSGRYNPLKTNKTLRTVSDVLKLSQQMAHLPFATLSSITEPLLLLTRANATDAPKVFKDIGSSLVKEGEDIVDRTVKFLIRTGGGRTKGIKSLDDEAWQELHKTGLGLEQSVQERLEGLAGEGLYGAKAKIGQELFFKANVLTQWTKAVQLASFTTGKRLIQQNAQQLATGKTLAGRTVSKENREYLIQQLNDLGVDDNKAVKWYKLHSNKAGEFDFNKAKQKAFYTKDIQKGANRFTKEIILNPSTAEANRPLWFSNPSAQLLIQFAGYPTVFNNTILKRFFNETANNTTQAVPKILATTLLMTGIAHVGNIIRSSGANLNDYETGARKSDGELIGDAVRRWGGFGPFDYASRYADEGTRNVGPIAQAAKTFAGPIPQDVIDSILYRKGFAELGVTNLPFYSAYDLIGGEGTKKELRAAARTIDKGKSSTKKKKFKPMQLAKGGLVTDVPQVPQEPDERIDKITGIPYDIQAGSIMKDEEERVLVNRGGLLNKLRARKTYQDGGVISEAVKTVKESLRSMFFKSQRSWESDHGSLPIRTHDAREANKKETDKTFDIAYGHKINEVELASGQIHGIKFIDNEGNFIPLTEEQKEYIQQKDNEVNVNIARKNGWDKKLKDQGLSWDTIDEQYKLALEDLAYNVGGNKAATEWTDIFKDIKNNNVKSFVSNLRRKDNNKYSAGLDNRAAKAAYSAGLIKNLEEAKEYGLELTNTNEIPSRTIEEK